MPRLNRGDTVYINNHDSGHSLSRYASDLPEYRATAAKMLVTYYMCNLSGTLFLLQGQEVGMANVPREWGVEDYIDVKGRNAYNAILKQRGEGAVISDATREFRLKARDNGRVPMQWDASLNAEISKGEPWMKVNDDFRKWNFESQKGDADSVLAYWRDMLPLRRREENTFTYGWFEMVDLERSGEDMFAFTMSSAAGEKKALVAVKFLGSAAKALQQVVSKVREN